MPAIENLRNALTSCFPTSKSLPARNGAETFAPLGEARLAGDVVRRAAGQSKPSMHFELRNSEAELDHSKHLIQAHPGVAHVATQPNDISHAHAVTLKPGEPAGIASELAARLLNDTRATSVSVKSQEVKEQNAAVALRTISHTKANGEKATIFFEQFASNGLYDPSRIS